MPLLHSPSTKTSTNLSTIIFISTVLFNLFFFVHAQDQKISCCNVTDAELEKFQHIRERSNQFLFVLGVQKSGTTVVYELISAHPKTRIAISKQGMFGATVGALKELHFFDTPNLKFENYIKSFNLTALKEGYIMTEGTPSYLGYPGGACLMKNFLPNAKFVIVLKNPADRAFSNFKMREFGKLCHRIQGDPCGKSLPDFVTPMKKEIQGFKEKNCDFPRQSWAECYGCWPGRNTITRGFYGPQLLNWLEYFSPEHFLILNYKNIHDWQRTANKIYQFAGLEPYQLQGEIKGVVGIEHNKTENIKEGLEILEEFYGPYNQILYDVLKKDFNMTDFSFH